MKPAFPEKLRDHPSYQLHRRQVWIQVIVPILLAGLVFLILTLLLSFTGLLKENKDVERWAAISTIWLVLPVLAAGLVALIIFGGCIYLVYQITRQIPTYTYQAQRFVYRVNGIARQIDGMARKPVLMIQQIFKIVNGYLRRM